MQFIFTYLNEKCHSKSTSVSRRKNMFKKVIARLLVVTLAVSMLAGCGNGKESTGDSSTAGETDSTADSTETENLSSESESVEISIMSWHGEGGETKYYDGLKYVMDEYTKENPNVTFKYVMQPLDGYMDLLDTQFISNSATDLIYMQPHMSRAFTEKGVLLGLDEYMYAQTPYSDGQRWVDTFSGGEDSFMENKASNASGSIMFVPMDSSAVLSMGQPFFYNKDLFEQAGITTLPTTFEEFLAALQQLQDAGITPVAGEYSDRHVSWSLGWISDQYGEHYIDQYFDDKYNGSDKVELYMDKSNIAIATDMLNSDDQILQDISTALYEYSQYWQDGWAGASFDEAKNLFLMQEAAIFQEGFWSFSQYEDVITDFEWGVLPIPLITKDTSEYAMEGFRKASGQQDCGFNVNKEVAGDENKLAAVMDFLQFLTSKEIQQKYTEIAISLSPVEGVIQPDEMLPFIFETDKCIYEQPLGSAYVDLGDAGIWQGLSQEYLTGKIDILTYNEKALANSKLTAVEQCQDKLDTLPAGIEEAKEKLEELKAGETEEALITAQQATVTLLELKLEMYQQYCQDL